MKNKYELYLDSLLESELGFENNLNGDISFLVVSLSNYRAMVENLGVQTIYGILNDSENVSVQRAFIPDQEDMNIQTIKSIENKDKAKNFDFVGISFCNPLQIIKYFEFMKKSNIPILSKERSVNDPIIIAGGMGVSNPEPFADFIDIFVIGDGIKPTELLIKKYESSNNKEDFFKSILNIQGVYVPQFYQPNYDNNLFSGFNQKIFVPSRIIPNIDFDTKFKYNISQRTTKDLSALIIDKGCKGVCSFCQYSYIKGPGYVQADIKEIKKTIDILHDFGVDKTYLYSASATNHSNLFEILDYFDKKNIIPDIQPSRSDQYDDQLLGYLKRYTDRISLNMDASSDRIRREIVKKTNMSNEDFIDLARKAHDKFGFNIFSMYQIINFISETKEDRLEIGKSIKKIFEIDPNIILNLYINPIFPSPNTPYEIFPMEHPNITMQRIKEIWDEVSSISKMIDNDYKNYKFDTRDSLSGKTETISFRTINPVDQMLEGLTLRGDRRSGLLIYQAYEKGIFNSDNPNNTLNMLKDLYLSNNLNISMYFGDYIGKLLPWEHLRSEKFDKMIKLRSKKLLRYYNG